MMVQIQGYFKNTDKHLINVDSVESVSIQRERHGNSDNVELVVNLTTQVLRVSFLSYKEECEKAYDDLFNAMRAKHQEFVYSKEK